MAWPVQRTRFWTTFPPAPGANVASGSTKKLYGFGQPLKVSLQFPTKRTRHHGFQAVGARNHVFLTKTLQNGKAAWPGRFNGPVFEPHFPQPRGQNVTSGSTKKLYGCRQALQVSLQFSYQTRSRPRFWSDRETAGPGRFTKPIFRTKRTPQNGKTAWPGRFFAIKFSHADLLLLSFSGRAPPCRQGSADFLINLQPRA